MLFTKKNKDTPYPIEPLTHKAHPYPGILIAVEGVDGSGKSTQMYLIKKWLVAKGLPVTFTEWNSSPLASSIIKKGKKKNLLNNITFSILHATDFADRLHNLIIPSLKQGQIVLADRYAFTAFARDVARECDPEWVRKMYSFRIEPDATFYFKIPVELSLKRITLTRKPKFYEAGQDMNLSNDPYKSYSIFQKRVIDEYEKMITEFNFKVIDGSLNIPEQQAIFRKEVASLIKGLKQ